MDILPELLVSGIAFGALLSLVSLGFVIQFRATATLNFAQGALLVLGAYIVARVSVDAGLGFWPAFLISVAAVTLLGVVIERFLVRPLFGRGLFVLGIMTLGLDLVLLTVLQYLIRDRVYPLGDPWGNEIIDLGGGVTLPLSRFVALLVAIAIGVAFFTWFKFHSWGVAMRAAAEDPATAALMGIRLGRISSAAWALAGALAAVAGMFLATFPTAGAEPSLRLVAFAAFPAIALGGFDSTSGAILGGMIIGITTQLVLGYSQDLDFLGRGFHQVVPYVVLIAVLLFKPDGLLGTKEIHRV
jgi:branched-chain amino acid transport system permease protein